MARTTLCILAIVETFELHCDEDCERGGAKKHFFAHSEQLLLAMCTDKDVAVRKKAVNKFKKLRGYFLSITEDEELTDVKADNERFNIDEELLIPTEDKVDEDADATEKSCEKTSKIIKKVILPKLMFHATNYYNMIDWDTELETQPPFLTSQSDEVVLRILEEPLSVPKWPNHTQTVERGIRVMTEACTEVAGYKARDGYIRQRLSCRRIMLTFRTKNQFNFNY